MINKIISVLALAGIIATGAVAFNIIPTHEQGE